MAELNITVKVPGLEKLLDVAASGIGAIAGPLLVPWIAKQQGRMRRIDAMAQADSLRTIAQAQADARRALVPKDAATGTLEMAQDQITQRLEFQERKRQQNIVSVVRQAADEISDEEVPDHEPDHDWTARFFEYVQDVSEENIRGLWAKILAREIKSPGGVSVRTLSILRNMSRREAELFMEAMRYRIDDWILPKLCTQSSDVLTPNDFHYVFVDIGLFYSTIAERPPRRMSLDKDGVGHLVTAKHILFLRGLPNRGIDEDGNKAVLKPAATELARICDVTIDQAYLRRIAKQLSTKNCTLQIAPIERITPDGYQFDHGKVRTVEPM